MPAATYEDLLVEVAPQAIETDKQYREIGNRFGDLVGKARARTIEETKLMRLLPILVDDYDRRHALPPDNGTPADRLRFLVNHSGKSPADLIAIFGQRSHVNEAMNGKRKISLDHARKLGKLFNVKPGLFI